MINALKGMVLGGAGEQPTFAGRLFCLKYPHNNIEKTCVVESALAVVTPGRLKIIDGAEAVIAEFLVAPEM
jgi:hypothetical protein